MICIIKLDVDEADPINTWVIGNDAAEVLAKVRVTMPNLVADLEKMDRDGQIVTGKHSLYDNYLMLVD